jgi:hypothetical protein
MKNIKLKKLYNLIIVGLVSFVMMSQYSFSNTNVYNYEYSLGIGFTTTKVLGNNPAINTISPINAANPPGGSFNGAMPGIEVKGQYKLDDVGDWRLVGGINYNFYSARERIPRDISTFRLMNNLNILSPLVGINYTLIRFPSAMSSVYVGVEARYNYIHAISLIRQEEIFSTGEIEEREFGDKQSVGRFGGLLKLGLEGELYENYMINVSWGVDALNLLGADDSRGNLLTPFGPESFNSALGIEQEEELTYNFYFSIMIQYRY